MKMIGETHPMWVGAHIGDRGMTGRYGSILEVDATPVAVAIRLMDGNETVGAFNGLKRAQVAQLARSLNRWLELGGGIA